MVFTTIPSCKPLRDLTSSPYHIPIANPIYSRSILHNLRSRKMHPPLLINPLPRLQSGIQSRLANSPPAPIHPFPPRPRNPRHRIINCRNGVLSDAHARRSHQTECADGRQTSQWRESCACATSALEIQRSALEAVEWVYCARGEEFAHDGVTVSAF